ncbi:UNVERIFIED_CONTAM: hypothetical protein Slati_0505400 [Sesamum latifolium]|uniref:Uncharacterized protein n=1 Tax=Sesamum latifolium TaxID=2727402 RepID=A0AAW2XXN3_9LAMI
MKIALREASEVASYDMFNEVAMTQQKNSRSEIVFSHQDLDRRIPPNNDAIVVTAAISNFWVKKILIDSESLADIISYKAFSQMGINNAQLTPVNTPLTSFNGDVVEPLGEVSFPITGFLPEVSNKACEVLGGQLSFSVQHNHWHV